MSGFRLNGWQCIGILLSVLWLPVGWNWALTLFGPPANPLPWPFWNSCLERQAKLPAPNYDGCHQGDAKWWANQSKLRELQHANAEQLAPWLALVPIPIAWLLVYSVVWIVRWIRRGFQPASG
jgi:hypothetical protein